MTDDLKTFKISDQVKKTVDGPRKSEPAPEEVPSTGFPTLEALVEQDEVDLSGLQTRQEQLLEIAKNGSTKEKQAAKKAVVAYERSLDVVDFLLSTKSSLAESPS